MTKPIEAGHQPTGEPYWLLGVLGVRDESAPVLAIQPADQAAHDAIATRFRAGGWQRLNRHAWTSGVWPIAPAGAVDVVRGDLVRVTTGKTSIYTSQRCTTTPMWNSAARERRALVALVPIGEFVDDAMTTDEGMAQLGELAATGQLLGAMATVRFDLPVERPR